MAGGGRLDSSNWRSLCTCGFYEGKHCWNLGHFFTYQSAKVKASWSAYCGLTSLSSTSNSRSSSSNRSRPRSKGACSISSHGSRCIHWSSSRLCTRSTSSKGRGLGTRGRVDSSGSISRYKSITTINGGSHYRVRSFISRCKGYGTLEVNLVKQGIC